LVVIDASAVVNQLIGGALAASVERHTAQGDEQLHAPHLVDLEVINALRRLGARQPLRDFLELPIERYPHTLFLPRIWELRENFTAYDAMYVALSEVLDAPLLTADWRLAKATRKHTDVEILLAA
jgi:predicted nucleic acid-binding protein